MPFNFNAPGYFGKLGPQSAGFNPNQAVAGLATAGRIAASTPNLFTAIQVAQKNQQDRAVKQAAIAQALAGLVKTQQEIQQAPLTADIARQKLASDIQKNQIAQEQNALNQRMLEEAQKNGGLSLAGITGGKPRFDAYTPQERAATADKEANRQARLEKTYADRITTKLASSRSGGIGLQNTKVDSAVHALTVLDQAYDPVTKTVNLPSYLQAELAANIANTISNQTTTADSMRQDLMLKNIYGDWNKTMQYLLGKPKNSTPDELYKSLFDTVVRQGKVSEKLRNNYIDQLRDLTPKGLNKESISKIHNATFGNSFESYLKDSPSYKAFFGGEQTTAQKSSAQSELDDINRQLAELDAKAKS